VANVQKEFITIHYIGSQDILAYCHFNCLLAISAATAASCTIALDFFFLETSTTPVMQAYYEAANADYTRIKTEPTTDSVPFRAMKDSIDLDLRSVLTLARYVGFLALELSLSLWCPLIVSQVTGMNGKKGNPKHSKKGVSLKADRTTAHESRLCGRVVGAC